MVQMERLGKIVVSGFELRVSGLKKLKVLCLSAFVAKFDVLRRVKSNHSTIKLFNWCLHLGGG